MLEDPAAQVDLDLVDDEARQPPGIDDRAGIGERAFELPSLPTATAGLDSAAAMQRLADEGDRAEVAPYLHPGLRLPS